MTPLHAELASGRWQTLSLVEQLANTGSEVERATQLVGQGQTGLRQNALERALELLDLTIADPKHRGRAGRLKELTRLREVLLDYFVGENEFGSSDASWRSYFHPFGVAVALRKEREIAS